MHRIFVDSDVVISSLISSSGAAYILVHHKDVTSNISSYSMRELTAVCKRLSISEKKLLILVDKRFKINKMKEPIKKIKEKYRKYTSDINDTHIVAGAIKAEVKFLISYNIKHFDVEKIKRDFDIKVTTPGSFLQYLRSQ